MRSSITGPRPTGQENGLPALDELPVKRLARALANALGFEVTRLAPEQKRLLAGDPALRYRHLVARDAIVGEGQITVAEGRFLVELVRGLAGPGPIVEIGTLFGWSTRVIVLAKEPGRELITVDNYSWNPFGLPPALHEATTRAALADAVASERVRVLAMSAADFYAGYAGPPPALMFIDGDHSYEAVAADIRGSRQIGAQVICGHDYDPKLFPGIARAVDENGGVARREGTLWVLAGGAAR